MRQEEHTGSKNQKKILSDGRLQIRFARVYIKHHESTGSKITCKVSNPDKMCTGLHQTKRTYRKQELTENPVRCKNSHKILSDDRLQVRLARVYIKQDESTGSKNTCKVSKASGERKCEAVYGEKEAAGGGETERKTVVPELESKNTRRE